MPKGIPSFSKGIRGDLNGSDRSRSFSTVTPSH